MRYHLESDIFILMKFVFYRHATESLNIPIVMNPSTAGLTCLCDCVHVLGKKLFNLNSVKRHLVQVAQPIGRAKFTWRSQLPGSEAL